MNSTVNGVLGHRLPYPAHLVSVVLHVLPVLSITTPLDCTASVCLAIFQAGSDSAERFLGSVGESRGKGILGVHAAGGAGGGGEQRRSGDPFRTLDPIQIFHCSLGIFTSNSVTAPRNEAVSWYHYGLKMHRDSFQRKSVCSTASDVLPDNINLCLEASTK